MPSRSLPLALGCVGAVAVAASASPAAHADTLPYTKLANQHITVHVGPNSDQACDVIYDLYVPNAATAATPVPAILTTNGFGGSKDDQSADADGFARHGYEVLSYSGLGFGGSGCNIELDDPDWDGRAASQLVSFLGNRPEVLKDGPDDPRVGTIGGSYGGGFQFALRTVDPRVDAMVPIITWNDLSYSLTPNNGSPDFLPSTLPPGVPKFDWTTLFFADGIAQVPQHTGSTPVPPSTCPGYDPRVCQAYADSAARGYPSADTLALLRHASAMNAMSKMTVPTMLIQGQTDTLFNLSDATANYRGIMANGAPVKLVLEEGGHSGPSAPGEYNAADPSKGYLTSLVLAWFDRYLKQQPISTGPQVEYFRDWVQYDQNGSAQPAYGSGDTWPLTTGQTLYLSGSGDLVADPGAVQTGSASFVNPPGGVPGSYSETSGVQTTSPFSQVAPTDVPGEFAAFTSPALTQDTDVVGIPGLDVTVQAPATSNADPALELVLFGKIYDVAPDGSVTLVHRLVSPVRAADLSKPVHINLPGIVHRFAAGHRLQLVLSSTDAAYIGSRAPGVITVVNDPAHPNVLHLPVVPAGQQASAVAPAGTVLGTANLPASQVRAASAGVVGLANTSGAAAAAAPVVAALLAVGGLLWTLRRRRQSLPASSPSRRRSSKG